MSSKSEKKVAININTQISWNVGLSFGSDDKRSEKKFWLFSPSMVNISIGDRLLVRISYAMTPNE